MNLMSLPIVKMRLKSLQYGLRDMAEWSRKQAPSSGITLTSITCFWSPLVISFGHWGLEHHDSSDIKLQENMFTGQDVDRLASVLLLFLTNSYIRGLLVSIVVLQR